MRELNDVVMGNREMGLFMETVKLLDPIDVYVLVTSFSFFLSRANMYLPFCHFSLFQ